MYYSHAFPTSGIYYFYDTTHKHFIICVFLSTLFYISQFGYSYQNIIQQLWWIAIYQNICSFTSISCFLFIQKHQKFKVKLQPSGLSSFSCAEAMLKYELCKYDHFFIYTKQAATKTKPWIMVTPKFINMPHCIGKSTGHYNRTIDQNPRGVLIKL